MMSHVTAAELAALPEAERLSLLGEMDGAELEALKWAWPLWARADQLPPPGDWRVWLLLAGRGAGKTRSAAEWVRDEVETGRRRHLAIVGPTSDTLRRDCVMGQSGILAVSPPWCMPTYEPSIRRLVWPNGATAHLFSSEEPNRLRGPNLDGAWCDELTSWENAEDCWSNLQLALRIAGPRGNAPRCVVSTTPKPRPLLKEIMKSPSTVITRAKTADNAGNLDASTLNYLNSRYGSTALGRQELDGELLEDMEGALWTRALIEAARVDDEPHLRRIIVAIDPSGGLRGGEAGIVVAGRADNGHTYVLEDLSGRMSPETWARRAVNAYKLNKADRIVAEQNFGAAMVESTIRMIDPLVPLKMLIASRGKAVRAEPVVALYEQQRVHHVGTFPALEDQMCQWDPNGNGPSPDRLDALVWAVTELSVEWQPEPIMSYRSGWMGR